MVLLLANPSLPHAPLQLCIALIVHQIFDAATTFEHSAVLSPAQLGYFPLQPRAGRVFQNREKVANLYESSDRRHHYCVAGRQLQAPSKAGRRTN